MATGTLEQRAYTWIVSRDTGLSSNTIWACMMGAYCERPSIPHDPDDFGRCYRLLKLIPEWEPRLPELAAQYPRWSPLVTEWTRLKRMYVAGTNAKAKRLPAMYRLMRSLIDNS